MSLLRPSGEVLVPAPVTGYSYCLTCVAATSPSRNFTDSSFSFGGLLFVTTILDMPIPFGSDLMKFTVGTNIGSIEVSHVGLSQTPLPGTLPLFASGLGGLVALRCPRRQGIVPRIVRRRPPHRNLRPQEGRGRL